MQSIKFNDDRVIKIAGQFIFAAFLIMVISSMYGNTIAALTKRGMLPGFKFLTLAAGIDIGEHLRKWGDGFETAEKYSDRDIYRLPIMTGDMLIERKLEVINGVDGALEVFAENAASCVVAAEQAASRIFNEVPGVAVFNYPIGGISGAKVGGVNYTEERLSTNEPFCPTMKNKINYSSMPEGAGAVIEFPIVGLNEEVVRQGLKVAIEAFASTPGIVQITSPSFGGEWGTHKIFLPEILGLTGNKS